MNFLIYYIITTPFNAINTNRNSVISNSPTLKHREIGIAAQPITAPLLNLLNKCGNTYGRMYVHKHMDMVSHSIDS